MHRSVRTGRGTNPRPAVSIYGMDLNRLRALVAAPVASVFLVLSLCAFVIQTPRSTGFRIPMPRIQRHANWRECEDDMPIIVLVHKDGNIFIRQTQESPRDLAPTIASIMANRESERVVYVMPDPDVPFSLLANTYEKISNSTTNIRIFLVTERMRRLAESKDSDGILWGICDLEWPENGYKAETWYARPTEPLQY